MNDAAARRDNAEQTAAAQRLLTDARAEDTDEQADAGQAATDHAELTPLLSGLTASVFSPTVRAAADELLADGEAMTVAARKRLVEGAERAVRWRKNRAGSLWRARRAQREATGLELAGLAAELGMAEASVRVLERGGVPVQELEPNVLATWVKTVQLDPVYALPALRRSLLPFRREGVYAGTGETETLTGEAAKYYQAVSALLQ
jgi:hypothetical protein